MLIIKQWSVWDCRRYSCNWEKTFYIFIFWPLIPSITVHIPCQVLCLSFCEIVKSVFPTSLSLVWPDSWLRRLEQVWEWGILSLSLKRPCFWLCCYSYGILPPHPHWGSSAGLFAGEKPWRQKLNRTSTLCQTSFAAVLDHAAATQLTSGCSPRNDHRWHPYNICLIEPSPDCYSTRLWTNAMVVIFFWCILGLLLQCSRKLTQWFGTVNISASVLYIIKERDVLWE